jgi:hypothetical protein
VNGKPPRTSRTRISPASTLRTNSNSCAACCFNSNSQDRLSGLLGVASPNLTLRTMGGHGSRTSSPGRICKDSSLPCSRRCCVAVTRRRSDKSVTSWPRICPVRSATCLDTHTGRGGEEDFRQAGERPHRSPGQQEDSVSGPLLLAALKMGEGLVHRKAGNQEQ